jgi:MFS transporter, YNFM family, putative membrane transport protein
MHGPGGAAPDGQMTRWSDGEMTNFTAAQARPAVFPVVLAGFTAFLDLYATQPLLPLLMRVFDASHLAVSLTVTASTIGVAISAPIVGRVADLAGRKRVIVGSAFVLAAATALCATASSLAQFVFWRLMQGLATPGIFAIAIAYIHEEYPAWYAGRATAAYVSGTVTGGFCGRAMVGLMASSLGWKTAFAVLAMVNVGAALSLAKWLPGERTVHRLHAAASGHGQPVVRLLGNGRLFATNVVGFCVLFSQVAVFTYVTFHLEAAPYGLGTAALGWLFIVYLFGAAVTPLAGRWVDQYGHRAGLALGMSVGGVGTLLTLASPLPIIVAGLALVGSGVFMAQATASSYIGIVTSADRGLAVGIYSSAYYLGGTLGGSLPSLFWESGGWTACVLLVLAVQAATLGIGLGFWRPGVAPAA